MQYKVLFIICCCLINVYNVASIQPVNRYIENGKIKSNTVKELDKFKLHNSPVSSIISQHAVHSSDKHKMNIFTLIINIIADLCPHGMLPLAYGLAQGSTTGIFPAILLILLFSSMSSYSMKSIAYLSSVTNSKTFGEIWSKVMNLPKFEWVIDLAIFSLCFGCCIFYSAFTGDIFGALVKTAGFKGVMSTRYMVLGLISTLVLLPLCLLEDLSALQFSSFVGILGIIYTVTFHCIRLFDRSYDTINAHSNLLQFIPSSLHPKWPNPKLSLWNINSGSLVLANMLCVGFLAHYNSINYYQELNNANLQKYNFAINTGYTVTVMIFTTLMFVAYQLFGQSSLPLILNNFPKQGDALASIARLAIGVSIAFAYPLMFAGVKSSMKNLVSKLLSNPSVTNGSIKEDSQMDHHPSPSHPPPHVLNSIIVLILATITGIAMKCGEEDVSFVLGIVGSVLGTSVAYILPGVLRLIYMKKLKSEGGPKNPLGSVIMNHLLVLFGSIFSVLGVWITIVNEFKNSKH